MARFGKAKCAKIFVKCGKKGEGKFERITWEEALDTIAENFKQTIEQYGSEAIWPYGGTGTVGFVQGVNGAGQRMFNALNTSIHAPTICSVSGHVGMSYTTGNAAGMDPEDLVHRRRDEVFEATGPTPGAYLRVKLGATKDGKLTAGEAETFTLVPM